MLKRKLDRREHTVEEKLKKAKTAYKQGKSHHQQNEN